MTNDKTGVTVDQDKILNQGETATLIDGFLHPFGHIRFSIDRITIVTNLKAPAHWGDKKRQIKPEAALLNRWQNNIDVGEMKIAKFPYRHQWQSVAGYILQQRDKDADIPEFRIEFNPNTLQESQSFYQIIHYMHEPRITRLDYAADYSLDLSGLKMETHIPKKKRAFYSRSGSLETFYIGHRASGSEYRIYDKAKESNLEGVLWRIEHEKHFGKDEDWQTFEPFSDLTIGSEDYSNIDNISDRAMLYYLAKHPGEWGKLHYKKKRRLKGLLTMETGLKTLDPHPWEVYKLNKKKVINRVEKILYAGKERPVPF